MTILHIVALSLLTALAAPALWALASTAFRRIFPYDAARIAVAVCVYVGVFVILAVYEPTWLLAPAAIAGGVGAFLLWRGWPQYGVASGLPPGSLWPLPVRPWSNPAFFADQAERHGQIFKANQFGQPMVCIVGLERANQLLLENGARLHPPPLPFSRFIEGGYLRYLPEETHLHYRRLFIDLFDPAIVAQAEPRATRPTQTPVCTSNPTSCA